MRKVKKKKWRPTLKVRLACWTGVIVVFLGVASFATPVILSALVRASGACGLVLEDVSVEGRVRTSEDSLNKIIQSWRHKPMLAFSIQDIRQEVKALTWVKQATIRRVWPLRLHIQLTEFVPLAVWHHQNKMLWVDRDGEVICQADGDHSMPKMPVISGEDAPHHIATFLTQVQSYPALWSHVTAFSHIRKRRWNMMLGHTMLVKLPQDNVDKALKQLDAWLSSGKIQPNQLAMLDFRMLDKYVIQPQTGVPVQVEK